MDYWLNQYSNYQTGAMNAAYNTFLTSLMVEYSHDQIANNITTQYNVTWSRTNPIIVSACEDAYEIYLTLECDHSMGMTVVGTPENVQSFNSVTSSNISFIEYTIMNSGSDNPYQSYSANGGFSSVMIDLLNDYLFNNASVESFMQNGFIIVKPIFNNNYFLVIDPETGIVRDINTVNNFCGAYSESRRYFLITTGFYREDDPVGETVVFEVKFWWDGLGTVLIGNSDDLVRADDALNIYVSSGSTIGSGGKSIYQYYGAMWNPGPDIDITGLLGVGENSVQVTIIDLYSSMIGCSPLVLMQVYPDGLDQNNRNINPDPNYRYHPPLDPIKYYWDEYGETIKESFKEVAIHNAPETIEYLSHNWRYVIIAAEIILAIIGGIIGSMTGLTS